jgi:hypothetical protein
MVKHRHPHLRIPVRIPVLARLVRALTVGVVCVSMATPTRVSAQTAPAKGAPSRGAGVTVTGLAFDSLRNAPLANAFVMIEGRSRSATTDSKGKFTFDTLPPGTYTFAMQHAVFDSLGLSGATARAVVTDGKTPVLLAVPSFATFWKAACGAVPVPTRDSGLVYGTVRESKGQSPVPQAWVELSWLDLVALGTKVHPAGVTQRRWKSETQADAQGGYAVCGAPLNTQLRIRSTYLTNATGLLDLPSSPDRVRRRDLVISGMAAGDTARRGSVSGNVVDATGRPVPGARVILDDISEARTDVNGHFIMRNVPAGSRQLDMAAIGMTPFSTVVDVLTGDTALVTASLRKVTNLEALRVTANGSRSRVGKNFDEHKALGLGRFMDSTEIGRKTGLAAVFTSFPSVTVERVSSNGRLFNIYLPSTGTDPCLATLLVDGVQQIDHEILGSMFTDEIGAVEVYVRRLTIPTDLMRTDPKCGVVAVWTKNAMR